MEYVTSGGGVWRFSNRAFKRELVRVSNGGEFDLDNGKWVASASSHRLEDLNDREEADARLARPDLIGTGIW